MPPFHPSARQQLDQGTSSASLWTRYPEAWDMLMFGLRLGNDPRAVVTTTPEPIKIIRELIADRRSAAWSGPAGG
jgi:phage terminase large subunit-like protein